MIIQLSGFLISIQNYIFIIW